MIKKKISLVEEKQMLASYATVSEREKQSIETYFVVKCKKLIHKKINSRKIPTLLQKDAFQEACIGAVNAVRSYDVSKKTQFITHAYYQIDATLSEFQQKLQLQIRIPITQTFAAREDEEKSSKLPYTLSYNRPSGEEGDDLIHQMQDVNASTPDAVFTSKEAFNIQFRSMLKEVLTPREYYVVSRTFGLDSAESTLGDVAEDLKVSAERIRQIQKIALGKLRKHTNLWLEMIAQ